MCVLPPISQEVGPVTQDELSPAEREARWQNACRWARQVNWALALDYLVFVGEGDDRREIRYPLQVLEDHIEGPLDSSGMSIQHWFTNDPGCDEGLHEEIDEWNGRHKITCYRPVSLPELDGEDLS